MAAADHEFPVGRPPLFRHTARPAFGKALIGVALRLATAGFSGLRSRHRRNDWDRERTIQRQELLTAKQQDHGSAGRWHIWCGHLAGAWPYWRQWPYPGRLPQIRPPGRNRQPLQIRLRHPGQTDRPDLWENSIVTLACCRPSAHQGAHADRQGTELFAPTH